MRTTPFRPFVLVMCARGAALFGLLGVLASGVLAATAEAQDCTVSPTARFSFATSVSPRAGRAALYDVRVYAGGACEPGALVGATTLGSYRRLAVTDAGVLVRILGPRTRHRDWNIVSLVVVARDGAAEVVLWLTLDDLPGTSALTGSVRATLEGSDVVLTGRDAVARVSFDALDALAAAGAE